jgi:hypothetical protein
MWDPFNLLELSAVPVTYLIDPAGRVVLVQPPIDRVDDVAARLREAAGRWSDEMAVEPGPVYPPVSSKDPGPGAAGPELADHAISTSLWRGDDGLDEAVSFLRRALEQTDDPVRWFQLGVALRMRYDSPHRRPADFSAAVEAWSHALAIDPNQYIWRRRLQQYGPRLAKPYPFYDWIPVARKEIEGRGDTPVALAVEPHGAEFAEPATEIRVMDDGGEPDPQSRVHLDEDDLVEVESVLIPPDPRPGDPVRVHLISRPNQAADAHWNNEAGHGELWIDPPAGWAIDERHQLLPLGSGDVSNEVRHLEFEVSVPEDAEGDGLINGYLLYYACEGAAGVCVYRRRDLQIPIHVRERSTQLAD